MLFSKTASLENQEKQLEETSSIGQGLLWKITRISSRKNIQLIYFKESILVDLFPEEYKSEINFHETDGAIKVCNKDRCYFYLDSLDADIEKHPRHLHSIFLTWSFGDIQASVTWALVSSTKDFVGTSLRSEKKNILSFQ